MHRSGNAQKEKEKLHFYAMDTSEKWTNLRRKRQLTLAKYKGTRDDQIW